MPLDVPTLKLRSGHDMPQLGLGTFQATKPGEVGAAVKAAVRAGYRLIDCAAGYGNQAEIGAALAELFAAGECKREVTHARSYKPHDTRISLPLR